LENTIFFVRQSASFGGLERGLGEDFLGTNYYFWAKCVKAQDLTTFESTDQTENLDNSPVVNAYDVGSHHRGKMDTPREHRERADHSREQRGKLCATMRKGVVFAFILTILLTILVWDMKKAHELSTIIHDDYVGHWKQMNDSVLKQWYSPLDLCMLNADSPEIDLAAFRAKNCSKMVGESGVEKLNLFCNVGSSITGTYIIPYPNPNPISTNTYTIHISILILYLAIPTPIPMPYTLHPIPYTYTLHPNTTQERSALPQLLLEAFSRRI
jgi:hypothetical protein